MMFPLQHWDKDQAMAAPSSNLFKKSFKDMLVGSTKRGDIFFALAIILMLVITYSMGDGTPLTTLNADSQTYNTSFWLKCTDMWIMSSIVLFVLIIVAIAAGAVKKMMSK